MNNLKTEDAIDGVRQRTAESLETAADSIRAKAHEGAAAINDLAKETGKKLDSSAGYVRNFAVLGSLRKRVRQNPVRSLALASAIGLVFGFSWRGRRNGHAS